MTTTGTVAATNAGKVQGVEHHGHVRFLGIPYGAPADGPRRFRPPSPPDAWDGVRPCDQPGPICPQVLFPLEMSTVPDLVGHGLAMGEDCLTLNVQTPALDDGRRPVAVWFHGGAFISGSASAPLYDGASFVRDGIVFVGVNSRLHALGFLHLDELMGVEGAGNCGLLDQIAALEWVRDHIAGFGGDPDRVTVFGESAGAMSIGALLALPAARGLVHRAALYSGAGHHALQPESATRVARRVLELLGVRPDDIEALRAVPATSLATAAQQVAFMAAEELLSAEHAGVRTAFAPVIDGTVLAARPIDAVAAGSSDGVDVLLSTCADEYRVFIWGMPEPLRSMIPPPDVAAYIAGGDRDAAEVLEIYAAGRPGASALDLAAAVAGDATFTMPAVRLAEAKVARGDRVWVQQLAWPTPVAEGELGACHALDLPFLFDDLGYPGFLGDDPPRQLADDLHGACARFVLTGDPNGGALPSWPTYEPTTRPVMVMNGDGAALVEDPAPQERAVWEGVG